MRRSMLIALVCFVALSACDRKITSTRTDSEREGPEGLEYTSSTSIGLQTADDLQAGRELARDRKFEDAVALFRAVYRSDPDRERRAEALLEWARVEASRFNPKRDVASATARLELLLEEFPKSEVRFEAEEELRHLAGDGQSSP